jgi:hypothetical protein
MATAFSNGMTRQAARFASPAHVAVLTGGGHPHRLNALATLRNASAASDSASRTITHRIFQRPFVP